MSEANNNHYGVFPVGDVLLRTPSVRELLAYLEGKSIDELIQHRNQYNFIIKLLLSETKKAKIYGLSLLKPESVDAESYGKKLSAERDEKKINAVANAMLKFLREANYQLDIKIDEMKQMKEIRFSDKNDLIDGPHKVGQTGLSSNDEPAIGDDEIQTDLSSNDEPAIGDDEIQSNRYGMMTKLAATALLLVVVLCIFKQCRHKRKKTAPLLLNDKKKGAGETNKNDNESNNAPENQPRNTEAEQTKKKSKVSFKEIAKQLNDADEKCRGHFEYFAECNEAFAKIVHNNRDFIFPKLQAMLKSILNGNECKKNKIYETITNYVKKAIAEAKIDAEKKCDNNDIFNTFGIDIENFTYRDSVLKMFELLAQGVSDMSLKKITKKIYKDYFKHYEDYFKQYNEKQHNKDILQADDDLQVSGNAVESLVEQDNNGFKKGDLVALIISGDNLNKRDNEKYYKIGIVVGMKDMRTPDVLLLNSESADKKPGLRLTSVAIDNKKYGLDNAFAKQQPKSYVSNTVIPGRLLEEAIPLGKRLEKEEFNRIVIEQNEVPGSTTSYGYITEYDAGFNDVKDWDIVDGVAIPIYDNNNSINNNDSYINTNTIRRENSK